MTEFTRQQGVSGADEWAWRRKLAVMCRIVGMQGSIGLFGHISIRIPGSDVVPIFENGECIGAIGVGGSSPGSDHEVARETVEALGAAKPGTGKNK